MAVSLTLLSLGFLVCEMGIITLPTFHCEDSKKCMRQYKNVVLVELVKVELTDLK